MVPETLSHTINRLVGDAEEYTSDADLVRRYAANGDQDAFAVLVRRHGPMVFGVCRRTLGHVQDAEDAFQATFVVLARRAHAVRSGEVSRFLYGVAVRVAAKARIRRMRHEASRHVLIDEPAAPDVPDPVDWLPLLDSALAQLPERDRSPILLCDLEGRSRAEAAAELAIAEGTLSSRLARSRAKLRARLLRLGIAPSVAAIAAAVAPRPVPAGIIDSTLRAGAPAGAARELAEGVLRGMFLLKTVKLLAIGLCASVLAVGAVQTTGSGADKSSPAKDSPNDSPPKGPAVRTPAKSDAERFRGAWLIESARRDGNAEDKGDFRWVGESMTFDGEKVKFIRFPGRHKLYKLDPGWDQKRIDFEFQDIPSGTEKVTQRVPGIYRFEGDKLHIVFGVVNLEDRPESFEHQAKGPPFTHIVLRRPTDSEPTELLPEEQKVLEGAWVMIALEVNGERRAITQGTKIEFKGNRFALQPPVEGPATSGEYSIDVGTSPRQIDMTFEVGPTAEWKGKVVRGIYSLERGMLVLCLDEQGKGRPTSFTDSKGMPVMIFVRAGSEPKLPPLFDPPAGPNRMRELRLERVKALKSLSDAIGELLLVGKGNVQDAIRADEELAAAELELATTKAERVKTVDALVKRLKNHEMTAQLRLTAGTINNVEAAQAKAARLKAEIELEKLKAEFEPKKSQPVK